jgi:hypothetical protein
LEKLRIAVAFLSLKGALSQWEERPNDDSEKVVHSHPSILNPIFWVCPYPGTAL